MLHDRSCQSLHMTSVSPSHEAPSVCHFLRSLQIEAKCTLDTLRGAKDKASSARAFEGRERVAARDQKECQWAACRGYGCYVPTDFLNWTADVLVGVGLGCLLQISRAHMEVKVSAG